MPVVIAKHSDVAALKRATKDYDTRCLIDPKTPIPEIAHGLAIACYIGGIKLATRHFISIGTVNKIKLANTNEDSSDESSYSSSDESDESYSD